MVARYQGQVYALAATCSHLGGPLDEGELKNGCIECPWHGSRFSLEDGAVERGPATRPQSSFEVRVDDGRVLVRRSGTEPLVRVMVEAKTAKQAEAVADRLAKAVTAAAGSHAP